MNLVDAVRDGLKNLVTGMGTSRDKSAAAQFVERLLSRQELEAMYRDDWIAKKIVNLPAEDMVRNGRQWRAETDVVTAIEAAEQALGLTTIEKKAFQWAHLYGGAAILIDDGGRASLPVTPDRFAKGSLRGLHVVSRHRLSFSEGLEDDIQSPNFGKPKRVQITFGSSAGSEIDPSRVIYVHGEQAPDTDVVDDFWGDSKLRAVYSAVQNAAKSAQGFAQLIDEAKIDMVAVKGLRSMVSTTQGRDTLLARWSLFDLAKGLNGVGLIDADEEEFIRKQISFTDHDKLIMAFLVIVSGAADIPATRMLGQAPTGLNATGESDLRNYYNSIQSRQETILRPVLDQIDQFLLPHALGAVPNDIWYDFNPLWTPTEKEGSEIALNKARAIDIFASKAIIDPMALKIGVESMLIEDGLLPGFEQALKESESRAAEADGPMVEEGDETRAPLPLADIAPRTLYVSRKVQNAADIVAWARAQGFKATLPAAELHVTIAYSRALVDWMRFDQSWSAKIEISGGARVVESLGDKGAIVLMFKFGELEWRHEEFIRGGASWDYDGYQPHITITYDGGDLDLTKIEPYSGPIVLGPEIFEQIVEDWPQKVVKKEA